MKQIVFIFCCLFSFYIWAQENTEDTDAPLSFESFNSEEASAESADTDSQNDDFGFGSFDHQGDSAEDAEKNFKISFGGALYAGGRLFFNDFKKFKDFHPGSLVWGNLHIRAEAPLTQAYFGVDLSDQTLPINLGYKPKIFPPKPQIPNFIEQAYMQLSVGPVVFGGGIKKLTWGRADAMSVLDVINPQDYSDMSVLDFEKLKIARPMFYLTSYLPHDMRLEAVFLPVFEGDRFALTGRWAPVQLTEKTSVESLLSTENLAKIKEIKDQMLNPLNMLPPGLKGLIPESILHDISAPIGNASLPKIETDKIPDIIMDSVFSDLEKKTSTIKYAQGGIRYTATINGAHDLGFQYYYGRWHRPAMKMDIDKINATIKKYTDLLKRVLDPLAKKEEKEKAIEELKTIKFPTDAIGFDYNPYHQIGIDYGTTVGPVNLRAEFAANITYDIKGNDPSVYNPSLAWNFGLDYTTPFGMMLNGTVVENIRLMQKKTNENKFDIEKGTNATNTKIVFVIDQTLLRDSLHLKLNTVVGIEDADFMICPAVSWQFGTLLVDCSLGFFGGKKTGELGQYRGNHYIKASIGYVF
ncbi:hypothetical protein DWQ65_06555 [Treponema phagedenis]|uniref:DUF5723 domain-containing protein n=1 Tax=Treponema phagedenis TaxID=162 RepID=A0A0B7H2A9_TREPH|nr:hypothetical protein [Treponema phagedenis]QEJ95480.1 hypothetical protein FUT79_09885 [Treponema phagedenis]QSH95814.1 hypothetical protein C5O78_12485 [Treponema phagedenis]QSH99727.1 hypothetical protein DWQ65_06555 [Treponema phagedenis]CEM63076.1 conserved exported hypothetical protein [Treponema phagedenis]